MVSVNKVWVSNAQTAIITATLLDQYIEALRDAAVDAEEKASEELDPHFRLEKTAYAQGISDVLGHLQANPLGLPVDVSAMRATSSQLAAVLECID